MQPVSEAERIRYDRQVRLWGSAVQQRLHGTVLILCGISPDETLKNLVLAGIGRIRVVDYDAEPGSNTKSGSNVAALARSVVALSGPLPPAPNISTAAAIVEGLRQLNNLVDAKVFDPSESYDDAACVVALVEPGRESPAALKPPLDVVARIRFFTESFALCKFDVRGADGAAASTTGSDDAAWRPSSPVPAMAALLLRASTLAAAEPDTTFARLVAHLVAREADAVAAVDAQTVEAVAGECLPRCGAQLPSVVLNSVLGGVLSQQVIAHACQVRPINGGAAVGEGDTATANGATAQPKPVDWLFVLTQPHIECIVG